MFAKLRLPQYSFLLACLVVLALKQKKTMNWLHFLALSPVYSIEKINVQSNVKLVYNDQFVTVVDKWLLFRGSFML